MFLGKAVSFLVFTKTNISCVAVVQHPFAETEPFSSKASLFPRLCVFFNLCHVPAQYKSDNPSA